MDILIPPPIPNGFGGYDIEEVQILKSAAGWYIGSLYYDKDMDDYFPWNRDSFDYFRTREEAVQHYRDNRFFYEDVPDESTQNHIDTPDDTDFYLT